MKDTGLDVVNNQEIQSREETSSASSALSSAGVVDMQFATALDRVTLPNPESAKMTRYVDFPVSPSLGTVDISIPVYEINTGRIKVPVSLQYNTSGIKVTETSGIVGLGWHLAAGGVITRTVCGVPDGEEGYLPPGEIVPDSASHHGPSEPWKTDILRNYASGYADSQYDRYSYSFPGHAGSFIMVEGEIIPLDATDLIIETMPGGFRIIDTAGTSYEFTVQETSGRLVGSDCPIPPAPSNSQNTGYDFSIVTGWHLSRIVAMDGTDEVIFHYRDLSEFCTRHDSYHKAYQLSYKYMCDSNAGNHWWKSHTVYQTVYSPGETPDIDYSEWSYYIEDRYNPKALSSITFRGGSVTFVHQESSISSSIYVRRSYREHLGSIVVRNASGSQILKAELSYRVTGDARELLSRVTFRGSDDSETDRRVMTYYSPDTNMISTGQDLFGYFNGIFNSTLVPFNLFPDQYTIVGNHGDRSYHADYAQALSLESITTGSGAVTTILYEGNSVPGTADTVIPVIGIGIRVSRIVTRDGGTVVRVRQFSYSDSALTIPAAAFTHNRFISASESNVKLQTTEEHTEDRTWEGLQGPLRNLTISIGDQSIYGGAPLESAVIVHGKVRERVEDAAGTKWTGTEYTFDTNRCVKGLISNLENLSYGHDEYFADHTWSDPSEAALYGWGFHMYQRVPQYITRRDLPRSVRISVPEYIFEECSTPMMHLPTSVRTFTNGEYGLERNLTQTANEYTPLSETVKTGYSVKSLLSINMSGYQNTNYYCVEDFKQTEYRVRKNHARLVRSVHTTYHDDNSTTTVETIHSYVPVLRRNDDSVLGPGSDPGYTFPAAGSILAPRMTTVTVDGDGERTYRRCPVFPEDYAGSSTPQYMTDLKDRHFRQPVGEETYWKGNPFSSDRVFDGRFIHYGRFSPAGSADMYVLPYEQWTFRNGSKARTGESGAFIPDFRMNAYDRFGNPTEVQEAGKPVTSYIWGYSGLYPVAEIRGMSIQSVRGFAFTSGGASRYLSTYIDSALLLGEPSSYLWDGLASLRDSSSGVLVMVQKHTPLVGPMEVTDPSGKSMLSSYDSAGRLSQSRVRGAGQTGGGSAIASWAYDSLRTDGFTNSITQRVFTDTSGTASTARLTVSRFDGLGRTVQTSLVGASPSGGDIVQPFRPDFLDREDAELFLPYRESSSNAGAYRSNAITRQASFYDGLYGSGMGSKALAIKEYENSRRGRVKASVLPGHGQGTKTVVSTSLSGYGEVMRIECSSSGTSIHSYGYWPAGRFRKTTTAGPDGSVTEVFTNEFGSVVLERRLISASDRASTYYVRDDRDRVICVVPPDVANDLVTLGINECYVYSYDNLDRVISRKLPRCTSTSYTYRPDGQVLTEMTGSRVFINGYDSLGRLTSRKYRYSSSGVEVTLAEYGYDGYPGSSLSGLSFLAESGFDQSYCPYVKGLRTWEHVYALDPDKSESSYGTSMGTMVTRAFFYDAKGRFIQTAERNIMGQISRISTKYDFADNPTVVKESHAVTPSLSVSATTEMTYDREGRMTSSVTTLGGVESRVTYQYDSIGRLAARFLGNQASPADRVIDSYTIQGWLKQRTSAKFTSKQWYENPAHASTSGMPGLAGNITEWKTYRNGSTASGSTYAFAYDLLSRLTSSLRYAGNSNTASSPYTEQDITYDKTGRVTSVDRYGASASDCEVVNLVTDSNSYDQYHNMTLDAYTGSTMEWSIINMIRKATPSGGSVAKYTFLADGTKARVNSSSGTYLYFGSMVFSIPASGSPAFESMSVAEGRIIATASGNEARYFITDHLGSVRTVLKADGTVVAENDFYPFGKRIPAGTAGGNACRHTFSGKEDQSRTPAGSPYLDFGARMYSPDCARWLSVDPMAEKYYGIGTHVYCAGDPVNRIDPDGMTDYFRRDGSFVYSDDFDNGMIRILSFDEPIDERFNSLDDICGDLLLNSYYFYEAITNGQIEQEAAIKIYDHYNTTGLPLMPNSDGTRSMGFYGNTDSPYILVDITNSRLTMDSYFNLSNRLNNHEGYHYQVWKDNGSIARTVNKREQFSEEILAVVSQMNATTWQSTTKDFKKDALQYQLKYILKLLSL